MLSTDLKRKSDTSTQNSWMVEWSGGKLWGQAKQNLQNFVMRDDNVQRNKLQKLSFQCDSREIS